LVTLVSVPQLAPEQPAPESDHITPAFCESFCTEAVKFAEVETWIDSKAGLTETEMAGGSAEMVMVARADFELSATEVAVNVTAGGTGTEAGARKVAEVGPMLVSVPQAAPEQPPPERDHITPLLEGSFWTETVKTWDCET
jgi:hypothetical protein